MRAEDTIDIPDFLRRKPDPEAEARNQARRDASDKLRTPERRKA